MEVKRRTAQTLVSKLGSVSDPTRTAALCELRLLTKNDPDIRPVIADEGAIPYLAETLISASPLDQDNAAAILLNVSISCPETLISTRGTLDALSHALTRHHSSAVQSAVAATVYSLLIDENHRPVVGAKRDIVYALIDIVRTRDSPVKCVKDALKALFGLALCPLNRTTMVELGAPAALFGVVGVDGGGVVVVDDATAVIAQLAGSPESPEAFRRVSGIRVLVDLLDPGSGWSDRVRENSVNGLLNLVKYGEGVVVEEIRELGCGFVFHGLKMVAENGGIKGRKRAETLIDILGGMNPKELELSPRNSIDSGSDLNSGPFLDSHSY